MEGVSEEQSGFQNLSGMKKVLSLSRVTKVLYVF